MKSQYGIIAREDGFSGLSVNVATRRWRGTKGISSKADLCNALNVLKVEVLSGNDSENGSSWVMRASMIERKEAGSVSAAASSRP